MSRHPKLRPAAPARAKVKSTTKRGDLVGDVVELRPRPKRQRRPSPTKAQLQAELKAMKDAARKRTKRAQDRPPPARDTDPSPGPAPSLSAARDTQRTSSADASPPGEVSSDIERTPAEKSAVISELSAQAVSRDTHHAHPLPLALMTAAALAVSAGAFHVLFTVLVPMYGVAGAALRACVPLGVEMISGECAVAMIVGRIKLPWPVRALLAVLAVVVVLACAKVEINAAQVAPQVAQRQRVDGILAQAQADAGKPVQLQAAPSSAGKRGTLRFEDNEHAALALQSSRDAQARDLLAERLAVAKQTTPGEAELPEQLAILGALGSSAAMPLLELLLGALRRRREVRRS